MFQNLFADFQYHFLKQDIALCLKQNYNGSATLDVHIYISEFSIHSVMDYYKSWILIGFSTMDYS